MGFPTGPREGDTENSPSEDSAQRRRGWLRHGNPPGDPSTAARCGAKTRRGTSCQSPAMRNGRCRMHGGATPRRHIFREMMLSCLRRLAKERENDFGDLSSSIRTDGGDD
jgi:hypothetical protein